MWGAASIPFWCAAVRRPQAWCARCSCTLVWARPVAATPAGAGGWGRWGARCAGPAASPPPPASRSLLGEGGRLLGSWGAEDAPVAPKLGGGGLGGPPPRPPAPSGVSLPSVVSGVPPRGILVPWGLPGGRGRRARSGRPPTGQCGGGVGGGTPPPWFAPPTSLGRPLIGPLRLRCPGRRRSAVGRQRAGRAGACLGRGAPAPRVQRPLQGGCGAAVSSVCLRPLLGLSGRGRGSGGGPLVPWRRLLTAEGGVAWRSRPRGPAIGWGVAPFPRPPLLRAGPSCRPLLGPLVPPPSSRVAGRPGGAVRVSRQRLAGCGAAGSPPRSLSLPSLPREVARAPSSRRTVGGGTGRGSAVWAVTCAAACVGAGAVAAAGCAGGSASGRGRCARPGGASCWRPHP